MTTPAPLPTEPVKSPERLRREELFLWPWRIILIVVTIANAIYAAIGMTASPERLEDLATNTIHADLQFAGVAFLSIQLIYYLWISWTFRRLRDWGMIVWALGLLSTLASARFPIG
ncbi:hypothetical protein KQI84_03450 [bacterium]|nr:hypothetical protein [bacterium]